VGLRDEEYSVVWRDNSAIHLARGGERPPTGIHQIRDFKVRDPNGIEIVFGQDIH
jgi:hypothetical protein